MARQGEMTRQISQERRAIRARLRDLGHRTMNGGADEQQSWEGHPRDVFEQAQRDFLKNQEAREYELLAARAKALDRVWESLRRGMYGICQQCGAEIPQRRLEAVPEAVFCINCQEKMEESRMKLWRT